MTSTLGIKKIQYPNGTNSITIDSSGSAAITTANITTANITNATATGTITTPSINGGQIGGRRNIVINGAMQISQRIGTTATAITGGNYGLDRWGMYYSGNSFTTQQVTDAPAGFYNSMKLTVTGTTTPTYSFFGQRIEGVNVNHIGLGTANCKSFTVSFYVKSSVAGVYSISMTNGAGDLAYPVQYTIDSANTWERKSMTIPPITSGTWVRDTTNGLYLRMNLGSPGSRTAAANGWRSGNFDGADGSTGAVTWATTSGATFFMTGCQIEVGSEVTEFEHRSFAEELALCQRYFETFGGTAYQPVGMAIGTSGTRDRVSVQFKVQKRATPTLTVSTDLIITYRVGYDQKITGTADTNFNVNGAHFAVDHANVGAAARPHFFLSSPSSPFGTLTVDAEL